MTRPFDQKLMRSKLGAAGGAAGVLPLTRRASIAAAKAVADAVSRHAAKPEIAPSDVKSPRNVSKQFRIAVRAVAHAVASASSFTSIDDESVAVSMLSLSPPPTDFGAHPSSPFSVSRVANPAVAFAVFVVARPTIRWLAIVAPADSRRVSAAIVAARFFRKLVSLAFRARTRD